MNKIGLFYAGGAFTGAAFEASASLVLDDFMLNTGINECTFYSGMSAGSIISSLLAGGVHPQGIIQHLDEHPLIMGTLLNSVISSFDVKSLGKKLIGGPGKLGRSYFKFLTSQVKRDKKVNVLDLIEDVVDSFAKRGIFNVKGLEGFMEEIFNKNNIPNDFNQLNQNLLLAGVNLNTARRALFGKDTLEIYANKDDEFYRKAKISEGVAASCCFSVLFSPYEFRGQHLIDGAMHDTAAMDIGMKLDDVQFGIAINPLNPLINQNVHSLGPLGVIKQVYRVAIQNRLRLELKTEKALHPEKQLIHFNPGKESGAMFTNPFRYEKVPIIMVESYVSMANHILKHYDDYSRGLAKINVQATPDIIQMRIRKIESKKKLSKKLEVLLR